MQAGRLNSRITFINNVQVAASAGGTRSTPVDVLTTNAMVSPLKQKRSRVADLSDLVGGYTIILRYRRDFTPLKTMQIKYGSKLLAITSIQQSDEDRQSWDITAFEAR